MRKPFNLAVVAILITAGVALAQPAPAKLDSQSRQEVIAQIATALRDRYVFPDVGARAAEKLQTQLARGAYDGLDDPTAFAVKVTADLAETAHDKHLRLMSPGGPPPAGWEPPPRADAGVVRADRLAGGVGYIEVIGFPPAQLMKGPLDRAMSQLTGVRALIVDIRRNGGGSPEGVAYLVSYFVGGDKPVLLNTFSTRTPSTETFKTTQSYTVATPTRYVGKPVYILTSAGTFSGGEELVYDLKALKRATVVGETTGGGANPGGVIPMQAGLGLFVPTGRPQNAITGTNWEGVGVAPDIPVAKGKALQVALQRLGVHNPAADIDAASQARLFTPRTTAQPGTELALTSLLEGLAKGRPPLDILGPVFVPDAQGVRVPSPAGAPGNPMQAAANILAERGGVKSLTFVEPAPQGGDLYLVKLGDGSTVRVGVVLGPDGKIAGLQFQAPSAAAAP